MGWFAVGPGSYVVSKPTPGNEPGPTVAGVVYFGQPVGSFAVGFVGQIEQVGFSLFAYDGLAGARTAVFFAGVAFVPARPPVQLHVVSSSVIGPVGEPLLLPRG